MGRKKLFICWVDDDDEGSYAVVATSMGKAKAIFLNYRKGYYNDWVVYTDIRASRKKGFNVREFGIGVIEFNKAKEFLVRGFFESLIGGTCEICKSETEDELVLYNGNVTCENCIEDHELSNRKRFVKRRISKTGKAGMFFNGKLTEMNVYDELIEVDYSGKDSYLLTNEYILKGAELNVEKEKKEK